MNTVSIRLPDHLLTEMDHLAKELKIPRTEYVRRAVMAMNKAVKGKRHRERLMRLSLRVREESMKANAEFSEIEHDPEY